MLTKSVWGRGFRFVVLFYLASSDREMACLAFLDGLAFRVRGMSVWAVLVLEEWVTIIMTSYTTHLSNVPHSSPLEILVSRSCVMGLVCIGKSFLNFIEFEFERQNVVSNFCSFRVRLIEIFNFPDRSDSVINRFPRSSKIIRSKIVGPPPIEWINGYGIVIWHRIVLNISSERKWVSLLRQICFCCP